MTRTTSIIWPEAVLGCPLRSGYEVEVPPMFTRSSVVEGAPAFARSRHDEARIYTLPFIWTRAQWRAFEEFVDVTLGGGLAAFMMDQLADGQPRPMYCVLNGAPTITPQQDRTDLYRVSFSVTAFWRVGATGEIV